MINAFAGWIAAALRDDGFMLIDVGCSRGIDPAWRAFGSRLRAFGFDASLAEVRRLTETETAQGIEYVAGFVGISPDHPFARQKGNRAHWGRLPNDRLSFSRTGELQREAVAAASDGDKLLHNAWRTMELADRDHPVVLPAFLAARGVSSVDAIKIDVDGPDFDILNSLDTALADLGVLALDLEVNFNGTDCETDHTLHNTDRFLKARGFELLGMKVRTYSTSALPQRYVWPFPAETVAGRALQGDAFYARDLASAEWHDLARQLGAAKLAKLAAIFAIRGLPDCAAELLVAHRPLVGTLFDVDRALDLLARQVQGSAWRPLGYRDYIAAFEANHRHFYTPIKPTLAARLAAAWRSFRHPSSHREC
jgi:hypothetical protein